MEKTEDNELTMEDQVLQAFERASICASPRWQENLTLTKYAEIITKSELYQNMSEVERAIRLMMVGYCMISVYDSAYEKMAMPDFLKGLKIGNGGVAIVTKVTHNTENSNTEES